MRRISRKYRILRNCIIGIVISALISFITIETLIINSAHSEEEEKIEYVVILGAGLRGEELSLTLYNRLKTGIMYLNQNKQSKVIVTGGQGPGEDITEAEGMRRFLIARGIDENRIIIEDKSTSTFENLLYTKRIFEEQFSYSDKKIMIVTCDFHIFRAKFLASRLGFEPYGLPSPSVSYLRPYYYLREYFAVIKSFLFDFKSD
ncbi:MAG: YdcF family protein [Peptococcia bacterium]